jgi:hypothetical protein
MTVAMIVIMVVMMVAMLRGAAWAFVRRRSGSQSSLRAGHPQPGRRKDRVWRLDLRHTALQVCYHGLRVV